MSDDDGIEAIVRAVRERGVELNLAHETAELTIDGIRLQRPWVYRPQRPRFSDATDEQRLDGMLLLADRLSRADADEARRRGAWFADAAGRLYVRAPGVLVDLEVPASVKQAHDAGRRSPKATNLMSPRRAQVVFCLLAWPAMTPAPVRTLARTAGVSIGLTQQVLAALAADRFLTVGNERLIHVGELLDQWASAYRLGLARRLELGRFAGAPHAQAWAEAGHVVYVGGEAAVPDQLHGGDLTLYVPALDTRAVAASGWRRSEPGTEANVVVRRQFWIEPDHGDTLDGAVRRAPLPLVFADLVASGEPRQQEVAHQMREQIVGLHAR
jgi:hypothetical protein